MSQAALSEKSGNTEEALAKINNPIKRAAHPSGETIIFDDGPHTYTVESTGQRLDSVTTLLNDFFPKFDTDKVAARCAAKRGVDAEDLKKQWAAEAHRGRTEGTNVHLFAECLMRFDNSTMVESISPRTAALFKSVETAARILKKHYDFIGAELIVASPELGIAGMIDLLMRHKTDGYLVIMDWKQNKAISTTNRWDNGFPPISHLEATDFNKYSLQLGVYRHLIQREGYFSNDKTGEIRTGLIHLKPGDTKDMFINTCLYEEEVEDLIRAHTTTA